VTEMETDVTHLYTYGGHDPAEIDAALAKLSAELELPDTLKIKGGHSGLITLRNTGPDETWAAMERAVTDWPELFLPRPTN
jgi:hypothetical protein